MRKLVNILVMLAVVLAPLEFAYAHHNSPAAAMETAHHQAMQHDMEDMDQHGESDAAYECEGDAFCSDCVYCSPALSGSFRFELPTPGFVYTPVAVGDYSVDLFREERPPKYL